MIMMFTFVIAGIVIALLGVPMFKRLVPPNYIYGLRVSATLADKLIWYEANARIGRDAIIVGIAIAVLAILLFIARAPETITAWINVAFLLVAVLGMAFNGWRFANRLSRQRDEDTHSV